MSAEETYWELKCDRKAFEKARADGKFPYIVTLARAINVLNTAHSQMTSTTTDTPKGVRDRLNSFLFASSVLYEILKLVDKMKEPFTGDDVFEKGLLQLHELPTTKEVRYKHLDAARNKAVFHFIPEVFAKRISHRESAACTFVVGHGETQGELQYSFSDELATEILTGFSFHHEKFDPTLTKTLEILSSLSVDLTQHADELIASHLESWGFTYRSKPVSLESQSQG